MNEWANTRKNKRMNDLLHGRMVEGKKGRNKLEEKKDGKKERKRALIQFESCIRGKIWLMFDYLLSDAALKRLNFCKSPS